MTSNFDRVGGNDVLRRCFCISKPLEALPTSQPVMVVTYRSFAKLIFRRHDHFSDGPPRAADVRAVSFNNGVETYKTPIVFGPATLHDPKLRELLASRR